MGKSVNDILKIIKENDIKMVDINGQFRHVTIPAIPHPAEFDKYYNL
ncbi:MAG: hypothetical protein II978_05265 [Clostridia bacterium]|nr:hypothetical protein [Clostridia bacterium]